MCVCRGVDTPFYISISQYITLKFNFIYQKVHSGKQYICKIIKIVIWRKFKTCVRINGRCLYGCEDENQYEECIMVYIPFLIKYIL